jgi:hypothetical protein
MPHQRRPGPPHAVVDAIEGRDALYEVELLTAPSPQWRAAFLRLPLRLTGIQAAPDIWRLSVQGTLVHFRVAPARLDECLRRIDSWIAYANSIVAE